MGTNYTVDQVSSVVIGKKIICPNCGAENSPGNKICTICGREIIPALSAINSKNTRKLNEYVKPNTVFAQGLPEWNLEPPNVVIRRH